MATLYISEYRRGGADALGQSLPLALEPVVTDQTVTFTTATSSSAFNDKTRIVRLLASASCHVAFGTSPTATASNQRLIAGVEYWRAVDVNSGLKVSVYDGSS